MNVDENASILKYTNIALADTISNANMIAIGSGAGRGQGSDGTCVSQCNVFLGPYAGYCITTGGCNVTMGVGAGCKMTTGDDNIALGRLALGGDEVTGVSVHYVNEELDGGEIILQQEVPILPNDDVESLTKAIQRVEYGILPAAIEHVKEKLQQQTY